MADSWARRRILAPILAQLRQGISPEKIALTLALGGVIGSFSGNAGLGALLGAGVGGAGGYLYDQSERQRYAPRDRRY